MASYTLIITVLVLRCYALKGIVLGLPTSLKFLSVVETINCAALKLPLYTVCSIETWKAITNTWTIYGRWQSSYSLT